MEILNCKDFSITYDGIRNAVDRASLTVNTGEVLTIVGESGSGKSTLLHGISGLLPAGAACKGNCLLFGRQISEYDPAEWLKTRGSKVSVVFQDTGRYLNPISRIGCQFDTFLRIHGVRSRIERTELARSMLIKLHLPDPKRVMDSYPFELSGGMRQRVGIAMAMALNPTLLLADEPTSALDVTVQAQVIRQMEELRSEYGTTIILVTHNIGIAAYLSDRIAVMQNGRIIECDNASEVVHNPKCDYTRSLLSAVMEIDDERLIEKSE